MEVIVMHGLGTIGYCSFIIFQLHFQMIWVLFVFCGILSLVLELISIVHSQYKNLQ